tara:strand:- start:244 stop:708 length:465 start_codon:yes stop_codon:yes gene_type:complete
MKKRYKRIIYISSILVFIFILFSLFIKTFNENLLFYRSPSQVSLGEFPEDYIFRIGGVVVDGSLQKSNDTTDVKFKITDYNKTIDIYYSGILPDLFREGQGVVIRGKLINTGDFIAEEVLAKHDETYMPPEVAESLHIKNEELNKTTKSMTREE